MTGDTVRRAQTGRPLIAIEELTGMALMRALRASASLLNLLRRMVSSGVAIVRVTSDIANPRVFVPRSTPSQRWSLLSDSLSSIGLQAIMTGDTVRRTQTGRPLIAIEKLTGVALLRAPESLGSSLSLSGYPEKHRRLINGNL